MSISLTADAGTTGQPLVHYWSTIVGAGRANEGLRATWQEHLRIATSACAFRYVRFHGLFHDDMFVYRDGHYNFQYFDDLFDRLLDAGVRPFVELAFMPGALARERDSTTFWWRGYIAPPADYQAWRELVSRTIQHWIDRYGREEVRQWYFEVWNEPNLDAFFAGKRSEYFELYRASALAIKQIDPALRVGGPATSNFVPDARFAGELEDLTQHAVVTEAEDLDALHWRPVWVEDFLGFCHRNSVPVDFISCHPYPTDWSVDRNGQGALYTRGVDSVRKDLSLLRTLVSRSPFPDVEVHITEWNATPKSRDHTHDYLQAATYVAKVNLESIGLVDSLTYWTFTDVFEEVGAGPTAFHGGFGLVNYQGIVKPTWHAYRFLHSLGDELVQQVAGGVVTRHSSTGRLTALAYHYPPEMPLSVPLSTPGRDVAEQVMKLGTPESLEVHLTGLPPAAAIRIETLDARHGNVIAAWQELGAPDPLSRETVEILKARATTTWCETVYADADGALRCSRPLQPWSLVLITQQ